MEKVEYNIKGEEPSSKDKVCACSYDGKYFVLFSNKDGFFNPQAPMYKSGEEFRLDGFTRKPVYFLKEVKEELFDTYVSFLQTRRVSLINSLRNQAYGL